MTIIRIADSIRPRIALAILFTALSAAGCAGRSMHEHGTSELQEGAELWRMTCSHCHNLRPTDQYSAQDWPIIVDHMRTRAGLTKTQANTITAFLRRAARE